MTTGKRNLDDALYRRHYNAIAAICENSRLSLVRMYWHIGQYITELSRAPSESGYGSGLLRRLSDDLTAGYGRGFSLTNLKNMRNFFRAYEYGRIREHIEWSGYVLLLTVRDPDLRREIETRIAEESLNHYQIRKTIAAERIARRLSGDRDYRPAPLPCERGRLHAYALVKTSAPPCPPGCVTVDCGFNIRRNIRVRDPRRLLEAEHIVSGKTARGFTLKADPSLTPSDIYTYAAGIERVIDGDTLLAVIDCGFHTALRLKLRLRGIDTPELGTPDGIEVRDFVQRALADAPAVVLKTHKPDKYERYLSDVFYLPGERDPERVLREGTFLNQELIDHGFAIRA